MVLGNQVVNFFVKVEVFYFRFLKLKIVLRIIKVINCNNSNFCVIFLL